MAEAYYLEGGYDAWRLAGYPLEIKAPKLGFF